MSNVSENKTIVTVEKVISNCLYSSDFYQIKNWTFDFKEEKGTSSGYNDCLCFVFVKKGTLLFNMSKASYDMHTGHIVIDKPNYEYKLRPSYGECTIFNFTDDFYRQFLEDLNLKHTFFFTNENILSLMLKATPECEYLHFQILKKVANASKLEIDNLVLELLKLIVATITNIHLDDEPDAILKAYHRGTIEMAKEYINTNFIADISLQEISTYSCVSPFHFNRIFKKFTSYTPHQYLLNIRLKHGEMLLKSTAMPISNISFLSGFNTGEYFATAFKQKYGVSPTRYREY